MIEQLVLGTIQGVAEWLPVSSEGLIYLAQAHFFSPLSLTQAVKQALFLHFGTWLAALIYFRQKIISLPKNRNLSSFLAFGTLVSGFLGLLILKLIENLESQFLPTGKVFTLIIGLFLIVTGYLQLKSKKEGKKTEKDLTIKTALVLGIAQGLAVFPGLSRSGLTVATFLFLGYSKVDSLRLSFLLSLPLVLIANIFLNFNYLSQGVYLGGLLFSFVFGYLTIDLLLKIAQKINFGKFVIFFGLLTILASLF
ncbi:MAG: undecaprenyl-diphosphate phosphatase [Candidatus Shapirobacteria bacterium]